MYVDDAKEDDAGHAVNDTGLGQGDGDDLVNVVEPETDSECSEAPYPAQPVERDEPDSTTMIATTLAFTTRAPHEAVAPHVAILHELVYVVVSSRSVYNNPVRSEDHCGRAVAKARSDPKAKPLNIIDDDGPDRTLQFRKVLLHVRL